MLRVDGTNWLTFEPSPDYSPDAGTGLLSPLLYKRWYAKFYVGKSDVYVLAAAPTRGFTMILFTERVNRQNTFVGDTCAPPSALLVVFSFRHWRRQNVSKTINANLSRISTLTHDIDIGILWLSVCPSRSGIVSKWLNVSSHFLHRPIILVLWVWNILVIGNTLFKQHPRRTFTWTSPDGQTRGSMKISRRNPCSPFFSVSYSINRHKIL